MLFSFSGWAATEGGARMSVREVMAGSWWGGRWAKSEGGRVQQSGRECQSEVEGSSEEKNQGLSWALSNQLRDIAAFD